MIIFEQLRISDDGQRMYINAHVNGAEYFEGTTIDRLCICLGSDILESDSIDPGSNFNIYTKSYDPSTKEINEVITIDDPNLYYGSKTTFKDLFFVYVHCVGVPDEGKCFTAVEDNVLGVTFDENLLYQRVMGYTKSLADSCDIPVGFTDFILLWNAFKAAIETEHYIPAVKFYNMLFDSTSQAVDYKPCGCHG